MSICDPGYERCEMLDNTIDALSGQVKILESRNADLSARLAEAERLLGHVYATVYNAETRSKIQMFLRATASADVCTCCEGSGEKLSYSRGLRPCPKCKGTGSTVSPSDPTTAGEKQ